MGICTSIVGILPSFVQIGLAQFFLLLFIRLIQVFAVGSEYISSIAFINWKLWKQNEVILVSWAAFGVNAWCINFFIIWFLNSLFDRCACSSWMGWRFAFMLAFLTMLIGFWIRNSFTRKPWVHCRECSNEKDRFDVLYEALAVLNHRPLIHLSLFSLVCFGVSTTILIFIYAPIHMSTVNHLHNTLSLLLTHQAQHYLSCLFPILVWFQTILGRTKLFLWDV